jgi:hypothetical protein
MPDAALVLFSNAWSPLLAESLEALSSVKEIPWVIKGTVGLFLFLSQTVFRMMSWLGMKTQFREMVILTLSTPAE